MVRVSSSELWATTRWFTQWVCVCVHGFIYVSRWCLLSFKVTTLIIQGAHDKFWEIYWYQHLHHKERQKMEERVSGIRLGTWGQGYKKCNKNEWMWKWASHLLLIKPDTLYFIEINNTCDKTGDTTLDWTELDTTLDFTNIENVWLSQISKNCCTDNLMGSHPQLRSARIHK